ncbi:homeobox domain-containing protein [Xylaria bambusicola]|uniref:homeobox domain-containing protein n=1 Tax=Xylaria bambusicola TaxID=326684 RepID=UPI002008E9B0|nr:homeobox domain-containing protein [Xylaria bambusicola]KAI0512637.1 homeobox domain-containing protein [Xylaria bambusicola]
MFKLGCLVDGSSPREVPFDRIRPTHLRRDGHEPERITLPPIREAFPQILEDVPSESARTPPSAVSPVKPSPEYLYSPNQVKGRRASREEEREFDRASQVPRFYPHSQAGSRPQSPTAYGYCPSGPAYSNSSSPNSRVMDIGNLTAPHDQKLGHGTLFAQFPPLWSPTSLGPCERRDARRLPPLPPMNYDLPVRTRGRSNDVQTSEHSRPPNMVFGGGPFAEAENQAYMRLNHSYGYHHPNRPQSLSVGSTPLDGTQYPPGAYMPPYQDQYLHMNDIAAGTNGQNKERRRRGNLPKETTDILRSWFMAHLVHPYPTEDEKHELMRRTDLQMNQISNWFINARRRQLPGILNDARAEQAALKGRAVDPTLKRDATGQVPGENPHSDGETSYEELDVDPGLRRPRKKRGSI